MKKSFWLLVCCIMSLAKAPAQQASEPGDIEIKNRYFQKNQAVVFQALPASAKVLPLPEQDCIAAIPICDSIYTQTNSYTGQGNIPAEIDPASSCLLSGEKNDVWYTFTVQSGGNLNFSITPVNGNDDYDWALFNLTNHVCADIFTVPSLEVSCNYAPNLGCGGITGPNNDTTGTCGGQNEAEVPVLTGETYVINVSNFSSTQFGYTINFGNSTAIIYDKIPPQPTVTGINCTDSIFIVTYPSELIDCSTIAADGSDFYILDLAGNVYPVIAATGVGCGALQPYVTQIQITVNVTSVVFPGFFLLTQHGSDGNSFSDKCGNFAGENGFTDTVAFVNVINNIQVDLGPDTTLCAAGIKPLLDASNSGASFQWMLNGQNTGGNTQTYLTGPGGTYMVIVTYGPGCVSSDSMILSTIAGFLFNIGNDTNICAGDAFPVLHTGITNAMSYAWLINNVAIPGAQSDSLSVTQPGTYVAIVDSGNGNCPGSDTIQIIQALPANFSLGNDITICEGDSVMVHAGLPGGVTYLWSFNGNILPSATDSVYLSGQGNCVLQVATNFNCLSVDSLFVSQDRIAGLVQVDCPVKSGSFNLFKWDAVAGASGYEVSPDGIGNWSTPTSGPLGLSHQTVLEINTIYVRALSGNVCPPGPVSESNPCEIIISNIITVNEDLRNDFFYIRNLEQFPGTSVRIFNRWGVNIYKSSDYKNNWDGGDAAEGVYFYEVIVPDRKPVSGTVTIVR